MFVTTASAASQPRRMPRLDVLESDAGYSVVLDLPGVTKDQLDVTVDGRRVDIAARPAASEAEPRRRVLHRERAQAPFARSLLLPEEVDNALSQARLENGVLTLTLARRPAQRIAVN